MARSPNRNDYLPPIRTVYDESYGSPRVNTLALNPYNRASSSGNLDKFGEFEYRLDVQERTAQQLIDKAFKIKQDLLENLSYTQGTWIQEKEARELLQDHIRTITAVIRQMNKDIKLIDAHLKEKETAIAGTGTVIRQIENTQLSSISEIRGRIGRCDSVTAKLANDIRQLGESIKALGSEMQQSNNKVNDKLQAIEIKNHDIYNRIDRLNSESNTNIRLSVDETSRQLVDLDNRTKLALDDIRHQMIHANSLNQSERDKSETKLLTSLDKAVSNYESRLVKLEEAINSDRLLKVNIEKLDTLEKDYKSYRKDRALIEKELEKRLSDHSDRLYHQQVDDLARFKREVRDSFAAVYETVTVMQGMLEKKLKMSEENLRKEMAQLRKMIVLI